MNNINLTVKIERAISELRRGGKLVVSDVDTGTAVLLVAAELIENETVQDLSEYTLSRPSIILSSNRSNAIGLNVKDQPSSLLIQKQWSINDILSLCMPLYGYERPEMNGVILENNNSIISSCLIILRQARLLPAGLMSIISNVTIENINQWAFKNNFLHVETNDIKSYEISYADGLIMSVKAKVPIAYTDDCEIIIFRPKDGGDEHFCMVFGKTRNILNATNHNHVPLVRVHSQCITGDILESLKCDCGQQLKQSIKMMAKANEGILIYLAQEGRDIGLLNKLRAYTLQENGMDTVEANIALGFNDDERLYYPAKQILNKLNIDKLKLITNNPKKVENLSKLGIDVQERIAIKIEANKHNKNYLETKSNKSGHIL
ncbi:GTP cyclohydrolase II [bacterium]|nr:GTP cyclohydrolase II [bacterium]